ncbi:MAG: polysaccharide deacetylase family protein [Elusimicrobiaceae bacterium]
MQYNKRVLVIVSALVATVLVVAALKTTLNNSGPNGKLDMPVDIAITTVTPPAPEFSKAENTADGYDAAPEPAPDKQSAGTFGKFFTDGKAAKPAFSLTFDDGPGVTTPELLNLLAKNNAKATFFMLGDAVKRLPGNAALVAKGGHLIGNHTYSHNHVEKRANKESAAEEEICRTEQLIKKATGRTPVLLRMPYGISRGWVKTLAAQTGYDLVNWTYGADWWTVPREQILKQYLDHLHPGVVFLMHDGGSSKRETTLWLVERILKEAKVRKLTPVTLDVLLGLDIKELERAKAALPNKCRIYEKETASPGKGTEEGY